MGSATEAGANVQANVQADTAASPASPDRYTAVVAALLDVRIDHSSARFDAELQTALAEGRIDATTARALRWWQRASVQALSTYSSTVLPAVLAAREDADQQAADDIRALAASWQQARSLQTAPAMPSQESTQNPEPPAASTDKPARPVAGQPAATPPAVAPPAVAAPVVAPPVAAALRRPAGRRNQPPHLVVVPDLASESDGRDGTRQAIRAAFRALGTGPEVAARDLDVTERKDVRGHADPAPSP